MAFPLDNEPPTPDTPPASDVDLTKFSNALAGAFATLGKFSFLTANPIKFLAEAIAVVVSIPLKLLAPLALLLVQTVVDTLEQVRPQALQLAGVVMGEIFPGANVSAGPNAGRDIGQYVMDTLTQAAINHAGEGVLVSPAPAQEFMGKLIGISVNGWLLDALHFMPEATKIDAIKDLVEAVERSIGIGRLARVALRPAINDGLALPLQYFINDAIRPKLLDAAVAVAAFNRGDWSDKQLDDELGAQGYSSDRQDQLLKAHAPKVPLADIVALVDSGVWEIDLGREAIQRQGFSALDADLILQAPTISRMNAARQRAITAYELQYKRGALSDGGFTLSLSLLHIDPKVSNLLLTVLKVEQAVGFTNLTRTDLDKALAKNVINLDEWRGGYRLLGFSDDDITILEVTDRAEVTDKEAAAAAKAQQKAQAAAEKKAAADQKAADKKAAADQKAADKVQAAQDKKAATLQKAADLQAKRDLLAKQAQERRDQITAAHATAAISDATAAAELARVQATEQAAADAVRTNTAAQQALDQEAAKIDQADAQAKATAAQGAIDTQAAKDLADANQAALEERRRERLAALADALDVVDQEEAAGTITAGAATKKRDALHLADRTAVAQERLDQLAIARALKTAQTAAAKASANLAKAEAAKGLVPTAAARSAATTAAGAAALAQAKVALSTATAAAKAKNTAAKAAADQAANQALDALLARQQAELDAFNAAHPPA